VGFTGKRGVRIVILVALHVGVRQFNGKKANGV
jgi:hypothetical protein